ncbi:MAG: hypothetical protein WBN96_10365 [Gammaproteobacteria bacterium]
MGYYASTDIVIHLQRTRILIFLLGLILLLGQFVSLAHATEHPFHVHGDYCVSLSSLEHASGALLTHTLQLGTLFVCTESASALLVNHASVSTTRYQARAPPVSANI